MRQTFLLSLGLVLLAATAAAEPVGVPPLPAAPPEALADWAELHHARWADWNCAQAAAGDGPRLCSWPGALDITVDDGGAEFRLDVTVDKPGWVMLPGGKRLWPSGVKVDGRHAVVAASPSGETPRVWIDRGAAGIEGRLPWTDAPDYVPVSTDVGLVSLVSPTGERTWPRFDAQGRVWLRDRGDRDGAQTGGDSLQVSVYRRLVDEVPLRIATRVDLSVAGRAREVELGALILEASRPTELVSELPARVDGDALRIFVRPGTHSIRVDAIVDRPVDALSAPTVKADGLDPQEIWVWVPNERLRSVEVDGLVAVDPTSTSLPSDWRGGSTFAAKPGDTLTLRTVRRGEPEPAPNRIELERELWLDVDGQGYTVRDAIAGAMNRGWRLEQSEGSLGRVTDSVEGLDLLITHGEAEASGVELRRANLQLVAESRMEEAISEWSAVGWDTDVQSLSARLHLPPGWTLVATEGVDEASGTWIGSWTLFDLFVVLVFGIASARLFGWTWGLLAALAFSLAHGQYDAPTTLWFSLLGTTAMIRAIPRSHWTWRWVAGGHVVLAASLVIALYPYLLGELRTAMYPSVQSNVPYMGMGGLDDMESPELTTRAEKAAEVVESMANSDYELESLKASSQNIQTQRKKGSFAVDNRAALANLQQLDPGAVVQTGPGLPTWEWSGASLRWLGPVDRGQRVRLWLLSPLWTGIVGLIRLLLFIALAAVLIAPRRLSGRGDGSDLSGWLRSWAERIRSGGKAAAPVLALSALAWGMGASPAQAQAPEPESSGVSGPESPAPSVVVDSSEAPEMPSLVWSGDPAQYLEAYGEQLERRVGCQGPCISVSSLAMAVDEAGRWTMTLDVHAVRDAAVTVPGPLDVVRIEGVTLDSATDTPPLRRTEEGLLQVRVPAGIHELRLRGTLPASDTSTIQLPPDSRPRRVRVDAAGWAIDGIGPGGEVGASIQLTRGDRPAEGSPEAASAAGGELLPWYTVHRRLLLGLPWTVRTRVTRTATEQARLIKVPLLEGEAVTSESVRIEKGFALVSFGAGQSEATFDSGLNIVGALQLRAPESVSWSEVWEVECGNIWQCRADGIPPVSTTARGVYQPTWRPWPGETVALAIGRPTGTPGAAKTITEVTYRVVPSQRLLQGHLRFTLRASQGTRHLVTLPEGAALQQVLIDDVARAIQPEGRALDLPVRPGVQTFELEWHQPRPEGLTVAAPVVDLGGEAVNARVIIEPGADRIVIGAFGPKWGPAILFWSHLGGLLVLGFLLGSIRGLGVRRRDWILLTLGFGQLPAAAILPVVTWFGLLAWRKRFPSKSPLRFNFGQLVIVGATFAFLGVLYAAVGSNLLGAIDMRIRGMGSSNAALSWYVDRLSGTTPDASLMSVPGLVWRGAMLVWSLWLLSALVRWLRDGWGTFRSSGVLFMKLVPRRRATPAPTPPPTPE